MTQAIAPSLLPQLEASEQSSMVLTGVSWERFVAIEEAMSDTGCRVSYFRCYAEIMAPHSLMHESWKSHLGCLVETWCLERDIEFFTQGNTTLRLNEDVSCEPDESYCFGEVKVFPDLAIEVALTSGGLSKRAIYGAFPVPELWIWRNDTLEIFHYDSESEAYVSSEESLLLPGLPISDLIECAGLKVTSQAIREFRRRIGSASR